MLIFNNKRERFSSLISSETNINSPALITDVTLQQSFLQSNHWWMEDTLGDSCQCLTFGRPCLPAGWPHITLQIPVPHSSVQSESSLSTARPGTPNIFLGLAWPGLADAHWLGLLLRECQYTSDWYA